AGAVEAVATVLCLAAGEVHPTPGYGAIDPACPADLVIGAPRLVPQARAALSADFRFRRATRRPGLRRHRPGVPGRPGDRRASSRAAGARGTVGELRFRRLERRPGLSSLRANRSLKDSVVI